MFALEVKNIIALIQTGSWLALSELTESEKNTIDIMCSVVDAKKIDWFIFGLKFTYSLNHLLNTENSSF